MYDIARVITMHNVSKSQYLRTKNILLSKGFAITYSGNTLKSFQGIRNRCRYTVDLFSI